MHTESLGNLHVAVLAGGMCRHHRSITIAPLRNENGERRRRRAPLCSGYVHVIDIADMFGSDPLEERRIPEKYLPLQLPPYRR